MQGAIESVGVREVLRLALAQAPTRLTLASSAGQVTLWCADDGVAAGAPRATAAEAVAQALALTTGTFTIEAVGAEEIGGPVVPFFDALGPAEDLAASWPAVVAVVPDPAVPARLVRRLGGPTTVTADQWRILTRVGVGRTVADLAALLDIGERASRRVVAGLVADGLLELVSVPTPLAPPVGPALAPPRRAPADDAATGDDDALAWADDADDHDADETGCPAPSDCAAPHAPDAPDPLDGVGEIDARWAMDDAVAAEPSRRWAQDEATDDGASWPDAVPAGPTQEWDWDAHQAVEVVSSWDEASWGDAPSDLAPVEAPRPASQPAPASAAAVPASATAAPAARKPAAPEPPAMAPGSLAHRPKEPAPEPLLEPGSSEPTQVNVELLGSLAGDDELVNRALLFKFLSSVRD